MIVEQNHMHPMISIIVPIYNASKYLPRCIESIISQTYSTLEIILVNDGSTDGSDGICEKYAEQDKRIKVIHQENKGEGAARNTGLDYAEGKWIGFVDADDWVEPEMFGEMLNAVLGTEKQIVVCGFITHYIDGKAIFNICNLPNTISRDHSLICVLGEGYYQGYAWNKLVRNDLINGKYPVRFEPTIHYTLDLLYTVQLLLKANGLAYVPQGLYHYCHNTGSVTHKFSEKRLTELIAREKVHALLAPLSIKLKKLSEFYYTAAAIEIMLLAVRGGKCNKIPMLRKEAHRYILTYISVSEISWRLKIRGLLIFASPIQSQIIWGFIKRRTNFSWWK